MRKGLTLLLLVLLIQPPGVVWGDKDDLFTLSLKPNVLLLIDGSGSMNRTDSGAYSVSYGVDLDGNGTIQCPGTECVSDLDVDGIANTRNDVALSVVLDLLDANGDGQVDAADEAVLGVKLGLMYYTSAGDNRSVPLPRLEVDYSFETIGPVGTPYADIKKAIIDPIIAGVPDPNIVVGPARGTAANGEVLKETPTAEAMEYVEHYLWPETLFNDPDAVCLENFTILITDGASDGWTPPEDVAASLYNGGTPKAHGLGVPEGFEDRNGIFIPVPSFNPEPPYYATTFAVGFAAVAGADPGELDRVAASGGTGTAFFPSTAAGLKSAVQNAITTIQAEALSVASPSVPAARVGSSNALYLASFTPSEDPFWYGELTAYPLQSDGTIQTDASGNIIATPLWEAHTVLNGTSSGARDIKTVVSGTTVVDFAMNPSVRTALNVTQDLDGNAVVNTNDGNWLIDYVRGTNGTNPAWKLGDIYHSSPVLIGPPSSSHVDLNLDRTIDTSFTTFRISYATRDRVLYAGSNAGVLHAFHAGTWTGSDYDTGTGAERWAFVPPNLLPQLQDMVSTHTYYVDGPPKAADVWLDGISNDLTPASADNVKAANEWHTVLVTGERRGGNAYFALDVTDPGTAATPNPPTYLWTFTDTNLGQTWSQAAIGKVKLSLDSGSTTIERWVAFVGGGYTTGTASGFPYEFTDKDSVTLQREFTRQVAAGALASLNLKQASTIPGATPPATCAADCFAYDPNGASDPASVPPATLGYVGGLDSAIYGSGTTLTNLVLQSAGSSPVGKAFYVIDMNTGAKLWEYTVTDDASMGRVPAAPTAVDTDGDGFADRVYVGDLNGNIWRFDLQAVGTTSGLGTLVTGWTGSKLFGASTGQPFYNKVAVAADPVGQLWVYGGTGDLNDLLGTSSQDRFYAIKEAYPWVTGTPPATVPAAVTDADLADVGSVNTLNVNDPIFAGTLGWYFPLPGGGEKILSDAEVFAQVLLFTSFTPTVASCTSKGGTSQVYALSYLTGGGAADYDAFKVGTEGLSRTVATMVGLSSGTKISMPVRTSTSASSGGDVVMFVCTSSEVCGNPPPPQPGSLRNVDYWRDL